MAKYVNEAFQILNKEYVNLDRDRTNKARNSRDWLFKQLNALPVKDDYFPLKNENKHNKYGSFSRNTKIRELDDIDIIFCLHADNAYYSQMGNEFYIKTENAGERLKNLSDNNNLNSIKIVNKFVSNLYEIQNYKAAKIHRRQEAATLNLTSYEWCFDIVPAFYTTSNLYLIPDGYGNWKATNPDLDHNKSKKINTKHNGEILQLVRTLKYWNRRAKMPTINSYLFENFVLNFFDSQESISAYIDINLINFWLYFKSAVFNNVLDPKGIEFNINHLSYDDKLKISEKANDAYEKGFEAYRLETTDKNQSASIQKWREIFGDNFPNYE